MQFRDQLREIEENWLSVVSSAVERMLTDHPEERFYAAGFWCFYCDYSVLLPPAFAMNSTSQLRDQDDPDAVRWHPPEWKFDVVDGTSEAMIDCYQTLHGDHSREVWDKLIADHDLMISNVCLALTSRAFQRSGVFDNPSLHKNFLFGIFESIHGPDEYDRLLELSVDHELLNRLPFPRH